MGGDSSRVYRVFIMSDVERAWTALVDPAEATRYAYGGTVEMELADGSPVVGSRHARWMGEARHAADGTPVGAIVGEILEVQPQRLLRMSWATPWIEEPPTTVTVDLEESADGGVRVSVTHEAPKSPKTLAASSGDAPADIPGAGGWPWVLSTLKSYLEVNEERVAG